MKPRATARLVMGLTGGALLVAFLITISHRIEIHQPGLLAAPTIPVSPLGEGVSSSRAPAARTANSFSDSRSPESPRSANPRSQVDPIITSRSKNNSTSEFSAFERWTEQYLRVAEAERPGLIPEGVELASLRLQALVKLIRTDPEGALAAAVPSGVRGRLPAELIQYLEEPVAGKGDLSLNCILPPERNSAPEGIVRRALVGRREYTAYAYGQRAVLATLSSVFIEGIAVEGDLAVKDSPLTADVLAEAGYAADNQPGTSGVTGRPSRDWTHGTKRVLIIRVDFSDRPGTPVNAFGGQTITEDFAVNLFNGPNGVRDFYQQVSYGQTSLLIAPATGGDSPDVTPVIRLPQTAASYATSGNDLLLHSDARAAAQAAGYNVDSYDRIGVVFSSLADIPGSKITYGGFGSIIGKNFWINGAFNFRIATHEIGHNYGLRHANLWQVSDGNPASNFGSSIEYGDIFDIMGDGTSFGHQFSPWHKSLLSWLPDSTVSVVSASGLYRVFRFDAAAANLANPLALKVVRDLTRDYWIGYRRASGNSSLDNGAYVLWGYNQNQSSDLLDLNTPGSNLNDSALSAGTVFNDAAAGITLHTIARGGSGADEYLDVQVTFQPRIQFSSATFYADEQVGQAIITLNRLNSGTGAVSVNFATVNGTALAPSDFTATNGLISWAEGDLSPKSISIPIAPDSTPEDAESFSVTLSSASGGVIVGPTSATVIVIEPGVGDPAFVPAFVNSSVERVIVEPDGGVLIGGWFTAVYDEHIKAQPRGGIARLAASGLLDTNYASAGGISAAASARVEDMVRQPDGKVIIVGNFSSVHGVARNRMARLNEDGSLDATFDPGAGPDDLVRAVLIQSDGKLLVGGGFISFSGSAREYLVRLNADGSVDSSFTGPDFGGTSGWRVNCLALQPDGKILVGGVFYLTGVKAGICRLNTDGTLDSSFSGVVQGAHTLGDTSLLRDVRQVVPEFNGTILIAGDFTAFNNIARNGLARLTNTGALEAGFAPTTDGPSYALLVQPDGKVLVGGNFTTLNGAAVGHFGRLTSAGALDSSFTGAGVDTFVNDFALQPDGRVLFGSNFGKFGNASNSVWRIFSGLSALPGTVQWSTDVVSANEGTTATLTATRIGGSAGALRVNYATVPGTASLTDFTSASGTLTWAGGETTSKTVQVPVASDALAEGTETVFVNLGQPLVGAALLGRIQQVRLNITEPVSSFASWQAANFLPSELTNPAISGDTADPDLDQINNLLEYAFGLGPKTPNTTGVPVGTISNISGNNYLMLSFRRRVPLADLAYTPQTAGAVTGSWNADAVAVGSPVNNGDGTETVTYRDNVPQPSSSQRFMRVQVQRTP